MEPTSRDRSRHPDTPDHVSACADCQARAALEGLDVDLDRVWGGVLATVWAREVGPLERLAARLFGSPALARALTATPSLVLSWLLATVVVLAVGVLATSVANDGTPWVALLAPALAGIGIANAYGPGVDPAFELNQTMAVPSRMILLVRVLAVFGVNAVLGIVATVFAPEAAGLTFAWLVPMAMVSALALAAATVTESANVGVAAALAGWAIVVLARTAETGEAASAVDAAMLPFYLIATAVCGAVVLWATDGRRLAGHGGKRTWQA